MALLLQTGRRALAAGARSLVSASAAAPGARLSRPWTRD
jgi:hypothetical protein